MKKRLLLLYIFMICHVTTECITATPGDIGNLPFISSVYGDRFSPAVEQNPTQGSIGTLNSSFGTNGSLSLSAQLAGSSAKAVRVLSNGSFLVLLDDGTNSAVAQYSAIGVLNTAFGDSGICNLTGLTASYYMQLDNSGNIYVGGDNDDGGVSPLTNGWMRCISSTGEINTTFTSNFTTTETPTPWDFTGNFAQQSTGRLLIVGRNSDYSQIVGLQSINGDFGSVDATFNSSGVNPGFIVFNGALGLPNSTDGALDIAVTSNDSIFVGYTNTLTGTASLVCFNQDGTLATGFGSGGIVTNALGVLAVTEDQVRIAINEAGNILIAASIGNNIIFNCYDASTGSVASGFTGGTISSGINNNLQISYIIGLNNGYFAIISSNTTTNNMRVDQFQPNGVSDTSFNPNGTPGYIEFSIAGGVITSSLLYGAAVSTNGQLYVAGSQTASGTTTPYVSQLYDYSGVTEVAQYPSASTQGTCDESFGALTAQTYPGTVTPFYGNYRANLRQKSNCIIEFHNQDLVIGTTGYTNSSNKLNMILNWLTPSGSFDTNFGANSSGQLLLENLTNTNETVYAMTQGSSTALYVAGSASGVGATLRKYSYDGTTNWTVGHADWAVLETTTTTAQAVGIALLQNDQVLIFENRGDNLGRIVSYDVATGHISDGAPYKSFGKDGTGMINTASYTGLAMGPVNDGVINQYGIFVAYTNASSGFVDVAGFTLDGSALLSNFGTHGIVSNLFALSVGVNNTNVRIAASSDGGLLISAIGSNNRSVLVARLNTQTGAFDTTFQGTGKASYTLSGSTLSTISQIQGVSDGLILITGSALMNNVHKMYVMRLTESGDLDTKFNAQGSQPGVEAIQIGGSFTGGYAAAATGLAIQSSTGNVGNLVIAGYEQASSSDATPIVTRLFGQPNTTAVPSYSSADQYPGTLDTSLGGNGCLNLENILSSGNANNVYVYPTGNEYEGMILVGMANGIIARLIEPSMTLDTSFNGSSDTPGKYRSRFPGLTALTVDAKNRIVIAGSYAGVTWAERLTADGSFDVNFDGMDNLQAIRGIGQQKSGRYIFATETNQLAAVLYAYQDELTPSHTKLQIDQTFNPMGVNNSGVGGSYIITSYGSTGLHNIVINTDDTILTAFKPGSTLVNSMYITKISADGSQADWLVDTTIEPADLSTMRLAIDSAGNIIAGAVNTLTSFQVVRYLPTGVIDNTWNPSGGVGQITTVTGVGAYSIYLTTLLESVDQQTILLGYNLIRRVNGINGPLFAVRLNSTGVLDETWNPYPAEVSSDVPGVLTYIVDNSIFMGGGAIAINGNVFAVGANTTDPLLMEIVGNPYVQQVQQAPLAKDAGIIDPTIDPVTGLNALNLDTQLGISVGHPKTLHIYNGSNGTMLMGSNITTSGHQNVILTKINADLSLDQTFNASGTHGYVTIVDAGELLNVFVADAQGDDGTIYCTGQSSAMWAAKIDANASVVTPLTAATPLRFGTAICRGENNTVLVAGYDGLSGVIQSFTADLTQQNVAFGSVNGIYSTGVNSPITSMVLDDLYRIYIAYKNPISGEVVLQRILANGSAFDPSFVVPATVLVDDVLQMYLYLDEAHEQIVVANYYTGGWHINRYSTVDGSSTGSCSVIMGTGSLILSTVLIDSDQNIYVAGYNSDANYQTVVARILSTSSTTIALDTVGYAANGQTPGIANVVATPMTGAGFILGAAILNPDRRIYVVGSTQNGHAYMSRFFGDNYATEISQAIPAPQPGNFDFTYNQTGYADTYANGAASPTSNQQVKGIVCLNGTDLMTVVSDNVNSWTVRVLQDGTNDPTYGGGQGVEIAQLSENETVATMNLDGSARYLVIGSSTTSGGYLKRILPSGEMDGTFGGPTGTVASRAYPAGTVYGLMSDPLAVAQLSNGNIIVAGINSGIGTMQMIGSTGIVSTSFGSGGVFTNGLSITSVSVDSLNNIYASVGYNNGSYYCVRVIKLTENGALVSSGFGVDGIVDEVIVATADYTNNRLALDNEGRILVAATSFDIPGEFGVVRLLSDGSIDGTFNDAHQLNIALPHYATAVVHLAKIVPLLDGKTLVSGYQQDNANAINNAEFVVCITETGELETSFNPYGSTPGMVTMQIEQATQVSRKLYDMSVQTDGSIVIAAAESPASFQDTPLTIRLVGYLDNMAVKQYPGDTPVIASVLNPYFNETGISTTSLIANLVEGGDVVVDSLGNTIIAGMTSGQEFVVARFTPTGILDHTFGTDGIGSTGSINDLVHGGYVGIDSEDNIFVGGVTSAYEFVIAKFLSTGSFDSTPGAFGSNGIAISPAVTGLLGGGYMTVDIARKPLIAGYTNDGKMAVARFTRAGLLDTDTFNSPTGIVETPALLGLNQGGYLVTDSLNQVYVGGATSTSKLVAVKFTSAGTIDSNNFGTDGVATTDTIINLVDGGSVVLDSNNNVLIGGITSDQLFAAARFTSTGQIDITFGTGSIAYSNPIGTLSSFGSMAIDTFNNIVIGGYARLYGMVVASFTVTGNVNTTFSSIGVGSTHVINNLVSGGYIAINPQGQIILGGLLSTPELVVAEMYSGYEIFIQDISSLSGKDLKVFYFGTNPDFLRSILAVEFFAKVITDISVRFFVIIQINFLINQYIERYQNTPGFKNLVWNAIALKPSLEKLLFELLETFPSESTRSEIEDVFTKLNNRIDDVQLLQE